MMRRGLLGLVVAASLGAGSGPWARGQHEPAMPPADLVAAWTKAGATVGWMYADLRLSLLFREGVEGKPDEVPAFQFRKWTGGVVGQLPQPQRAFGLCLRGTQVTDAGLKELQKTLPKLTIVR